MEVHVLLGRRDTWSDLQLFMALNFALVLLGGYLKGALLDSSAEGAFISAASWERVYSASALRCIRAKPPLCACAELAGRLQQDWH